MVDEVSDLRQLQPSVIIDCGGLILMQDRSDQDWYMGQQDEEAAILCWGNYGQDLDSALKAL